MSTVKDVYDIAKDLINLAKEKGNQEMVDVAINLKMMVNDIWDENQELKEVIKSYEDNKEREKRIKRSKGTIAEYTDENGNKIMICTCCWDTKKLIVQTEYKETNRYYCKECKNCSFYGEKENKSKITFSSIL